MNLTVFAEDIQSFQSGSDELHCSWSRFEDGRGEQMRALYEKLLAENKPISFISCSDNDVVVYQEEDVVLCLAPHYSRRRGNPMFRAGTE